jgi:CPA2 family monovalent cation:H+ antiporter-2
VFLGGSIQVFLTIGSFWFLDHWLRNAATSRAVFVGFLMALSSTAIVLKILQQRAQIESPAGRISLSMLIYQDLIIVPMMLAIPLLAGQTHMDPGALALAAGRALCILAGIFLLARKVVPWLLQLVVRTKSRELFLICIIGVCLGTAFLTAELGLSLSLGAFMAGLVVAESEYSHSALEGILPFRDVFTSVFFISVGMLLNIRFFFDNIGLVLLVSFLVIVVKALAAGGATRAIGYPLRPAILVGFGLCQVGEFSFVLAKSGLDYKLLPPDGYQLFLAASILTMTATPFLMTAGSSLVGKMDAKHRKTADSGIENEASPDNGLADHLIILGYGVGGKLLARAARMAGIHYVILEMNPDTVRHYAAEGEPIIHGDAIHPAVLQHLGVRSARVLAVVISDPAAMRSVTEIARHMNPKLHILVRTRFLGEVAALKELGASDVIPEEFETAIEIFIRVLSAYLVPRGDIERFTHEVRAENYEMLRKVEIPGESLATLQKQMPDLTVSVFALDRGAPLDGVTLQEVNLRQSANITIVAVRRDREVFAHPGGDFRLEPSDAVYVFSSPRDAAIAQPLFSGNVSGKNDF